MDPKTVAKLEAKLEEAIIEVVLKLGLKQLPLLPSHHTFQMMAKAAVAEYKAAVENSRSEKS
jgi:MinD-like ATPase involved in chromosome partitioning or flagellar assembly